MKELKLGQPAISWHTVRDTIAEVGCFLGLVTGTCGKIAFDVKLLMQTEVEEVYEPFHAGPRLVLDHAAEAQSDFVRLHHRADRVVKQLVAALMEAMVEDHERATGPWEIEWIALPEIFMLSAGALAQTRFRGRRLAGQRKENARESRHHQGPDHVGSGDDGPWRHDGPQLRARPVYDICREVVKTGRPLIDSWPRTRKSPSTSTARNWRSSSTRRTISASRAKWWTGCWGCTRSSSASC